MTVKSFSCFRDVTVKSFSCFRDVTMESLSHILSCLYIQELEWKSSRFFWSFAAGPAGLRGLHIQGQNSRQDGQCLPLLCHSVSKHLVALQHTHVLTTQFLELFDNSNGSGVTREFLIWEPGAGVGVGWGKGVVGLGLGLGLGRGPPPHTDVLSLF